MMAEPAFSPEIAEALDSYSVPPTPQGFSDRLMARIASGDTGVDAASLELPPLRRRRVSPWRRTSRILGSVAIFSLATATAAAAGIFGEPVYVPGVSEALVEAKIVEAPAPVVKPRVRLIAESSTATAQATVTNETPASNNAVVNRVTELRNNPEFAKLPPRQRLTLAGREVRRMVRTGEATREEARVAARELARNADPATKEAWRKAAVERREQRLERRAERQSVPEAVSVVTPEQPLADSSAVAPDILPATAMSALPPEKAEALRERYRTATPEQRAAMRSALREWRQSRQRRRGQ